MKAVTESKADIVLYNVKEQLDILDTDYTPHIWDAHIAAYLINPLKDSYEGVDIAKDFLDKEIAEYSEIFGKKTIKSAFADNKDEYIDYAITQ